MTKKSLYIERSDKDRIYCPYEEGPNFSLYVVRDHGISEWACNISPLGWWRNNS